MTARMQLAVDSAARQDLAARQRSALRYNQNRHPAEFSIGDLIWVFAEPPASTNPDRTRRSLALVNRCHGPWRIIERQDDLHYLATHLRTGATDKFVIDSLVPANYTADPADPDSGDDASSDDDVDDLDDDPADPDWTPPF